MASIELKSISGKGIKSLQLFQKPSLYAVISFTNDKKNKKKTAVDRSNGESPDWDQPIKIDIAGNVQDLVLQFELKADALLGDRVVGRAFIPMTDLDFCGGVQHVSYQLKTPEGKPNGVLNFSYKIDGFATAKESASVPVPSPASAPTAGFYAPPEERVSFYPPPAKQDHAVYAPPEERVSFYPPPAKQDQSVLYPRPSMVSRYYPTIEPEAVYPPPAAASGYYPPMPESRVCYPPPQRSLDHGFSFHTPAMDVGGYYPPPPPEMVHPVYRPQYEPPEMAHAVYPPQQESERCYRSIPQPAPGWYPAAPQPAPGFYPSAPPASEEYGYRQRGLYGYN